MTISSMAVAALVSSRRVAGAPEPEISGDDLPQEQVEAMVGALYRLPLGEFDPSELRRAAINLLRLAHSFRP